MVDIYIHTVWIKNVFPPESTHVYYVYMCRISTFMHVSTCTNNNIVLQLLLHVLMPVYMCMGAVTR